MNNNIFQILYLLLLIFSFENIKGKKAIVNYSSKFIINSIKVEPSLNEFTFSWPSLRNNSFFLECEPGDKILINVIAKDNKTKIEDFFISFKFDNEIKYFFNNDNIYIYENIYIYFYIPFETYCLNKNVIISYKNEIIDFNLKSFIFIKNRKIQSMKRLKVNIIDIYIQNKTEKNLYINFNSSTNYNLNKTFKIYTEYPITIKYKGVSSTGGTFSHNECFLKIIKYNYTNEKRILNDNITYYKNNIYNNSKALENIETIEKFFELGINIFNIDEKFFNDICFHYENEKGDVVPEDRIHFFYQNYSLCEKGCKLYDINLTLFEYTCECSESIRNEESNKENKKPTDDDEDLHEEFTSSTITQEFSNIFFETNFEVIRCFGILLTFKIFSHNIGSMITIILILIQFIASLFLFKHTKELRRYIFKDIIKYKGNPPLKKAKTLIDKKNKNNNNMNENLILPNDVLIFKTPIINRKKRKKTLTTKFILRQGLISTSNDAKDLNGLISKSNERRKQSMNTNNTSTNKNKINGPVSKVFNFSGQKNNIKENKVSFLIDLESSAQRKVKLENRNNNDNLFFKYNQSGKKIIRKINLIKKKKKVQVNLNEINENKNLTESSKEKSNYKLNIRDNNILVDKTQKKFYEINNPPFLISSSQSIEISQDKENKNKNDRQQNIEFIKNYKNSIENIKNKNNNIYISRIGTNNNYISNDMPEISDIHNGVIITEDPLNESNKFNNNESFELKTIKSNRKYSNNNSKNNDTIQSSEYDEDKQNYVKMYKKKDYDDLELNELDFNEAEVYDHREFCQIFCYLLKERQIIVNTFCVKEKLKPFSIKLIIFIFMIACYLVINGFLFNEEYVKKIYRRKKKGFYFFIVDSFERIVYSSIVAGLINIIIGLMFKNDKNLRTVLKKYKDNIIIRNGQIVKIFRSIRTLNIAFTIFNFIAMIMFWIYLYCFCGVYRNCQLDWIESCYLIVMIMNVLPILICLLLAALRKGGIKCRVEFFYKVSKWIAENT